MHVNENWPNSRGSLDLNSVLGFLRRVGVKDGDESQPAKKEE